MGKRLVKSKAFWAGVAGVVSGIITCVNGNIEAGSTLIVSGLSTIFLRDAIAKSSGNSK